ncbi:MAG: Flp pilus assembly complex ATPase component TadA [Magnetococcales bacterium]|nr:Flp pilus assembly complex ATPase component TadA [Magnetococcales bacterium]NGZ05122.1 Flp pilus assembly complex ATPase component TadA [Magnetococcales bacterium]
MTNPTALPKPRRRLGEILLAADLITPDLLTIALSEQKKTGELLGRILVRLGFVPETLMRDLLSHILRQQTVNLDRITLDPKILGLVPKKLIERHHIIPVHWDRKSTTLTVAMSDTQDIAIIDKIQANIHTDIRIRTVLASQSEIDRALQRAYGAELSLNRILDELSNGSTDLHALSPDQVERLESSHDLTNALFTHAVHAGATEIHIEPEPGRIRLRYRMDGVITPIRDLHRDLLPALMACIHSRTSHNNSSFIINISTHPYIFQLSTQMTEYGEKGVVRIRPQHPQPWSLEELGLSRATQETLWTMLTRPGGVVLVTGPTESGKTTTLQTMLRLLDHDQMQIVTPTTLSAGSTSWLNGIDAWRPDLVLLDDLATARQARLALHAAMNGHKVLVGLCAPSTIGALQRLRFLGIRSELLAGNMVGMIHQRLVRCLCPHCKRVHPPDPETQRLLASSPTPSKQIYTAVGCTRCQGSGFKGRAVIMEALLIDETLNNWMEQGASRTTLPILTQEPGLPSLLDEGMRRIALGQTTLPEISRILDLHRGVFR